MLFHLVFPFAHFVSFFNVFGYITFRSVIAFIITFTISVILIPFFIKMMKKINAKQIIRDDGPQSHKVKIGTPTMGGIVVIIAILFGMLISGNFSNLYVWLVLFATVAFGIVGFIDDYLKISKKSSEGMHSKIKLVLQFSIALIITVVLYFVIGKEDAVNNKSLFNYFLVNKFAYITIPFLKNIKIYLSIFYIPLGIFIIIGSSNAVNLTDGLDGLAAGLLIPVTVTFGLLSYISGHIKMSDYLFMDFIPMSSELLVYCFAMLGGLTGFLWFNAHPAEVFMGDTGSLAFGGIIGTISMMIKQELLLAIVGGVFVAETFSVMIQVLYYKRTKKRVFLMAPLHHHFEMKGWKESKIISRFYIIGGIFAIIALGSLKLR